MAQSSTLSEQQKRQQFAVGQAVHRLLAATAEGTAFVTIQRRDLVLLLATLRYRSPKRAL